MGVTTSYTPLMDFSRPFTVEDLRNARGNVDAVRDANGHVTSFEYDRGVVATTHTPEYSLTSTINDDGTVQSTTRRGATTVFEYDSLGRQTNVHPALGSDTRTSYSPDGHSVTISRGTSTTTSTLDGFGRVLATAAPTRRPSGMPGPTPPAT
jgi:YD repeat-containing protein